MATVLPYGFIAQDNGDESSLQWMVDQRANWVRLDAHTHDGSNSAPINPANIVKQTQAIASASWVLVDDGIYRQQISMPTGYEYEGAFIKFNEDLSGDEYLLETEKTGTSSYWVYINDNTLDITARYF